MNFKTWIYSVIIIMMLILLTNRCKKNDNNIEPICKTRNWTSNNGFSNWVTTSNSNCNCIPCSSLETRNIIYNSYGQPSKYDQYQWENCDNGVYSAPVLLYPTNNSIITTSITCSWSCNNPDDNTLTYDIFFGKSNPPPLIISDTNSTSFTQNNLDNSTNYYCEIIANYCSGVSIPSKIWNFKTANGIPNIATDSIFNITSNSANCGGTVTSDGGANLTARGVCWSVGQTPTIYDNKTTDGIGVGGFTSFLNGLSNSTTYFVRAYATNSFGTGYGSVKSFTTYFGSATDVDGNVYNTIVIGTQVWMLENLKVTHYRNGEAIPNVIDSTVWPTLNSGAYCWYNNNIANKVTYGALYNWYAVTDSRNIAPIGWHVPSDADWITLITYLGGESVAGKKMKEVGTTHWGAQNTSATNESGFTALPGGLRYHYQGIFGYLGLFGVFWSSSQYAHTRELRFNSSKCVRSAFENKEIGYSVRCLKD